MSKQLAVDYYNTLCWAKDEARAIGYTCDRYRGNSYFILKLTRAELLDMVNMCADHSRELPKFDPRQQVVWLFLTALMAKFPDEGNIHHRLPEKTLKFEIGPNGWQRFTLDEGEQWLVDYAQLDRFLTEVASD